MSNQNINRNKYNAYLLLEGMLSNELPNPVSLQEVLDEDRLYSLLQKIDNGEYDDIYAVCEETHLITHIRINSNMSPSYIYNNGVESIDYFDFKNNNKYRLLSIPHIIHYIAFVYNTMKG